MSASLYWEENPPGPNLSATNVSGLVLYHIWYRTFRSIRLNESLILDQFSWDLASAQSYSGISGSNSIVGAMFQRFSVGHLDVPFDYLAKEGKKLVFCPFSIINRRASSLFCSSMSRWNTFLFWYNSLSGISLKAYRLSINWDSEVIK